ncbi:MAG: hypothetical protein ACR2HN_07505 [Tepidiformaceae bacterium]
MSVETARFAARCRFLQVTLGERAGGHLVNLCRHSVRDGSLCVGPFLDDTETSCGLWEGGERAHPRGGRQGEA